MAISLRCRRYLLFSYIVVLMISGVALALCGAWLLLSLYSVSHGLVLASSAWSTMAALLCAGVASLLLGWWGWRATAQRNRSRINVFTWSLILLIGGLFAVCGVSLALRQSLPEQSAGLVEASFSKALQGDRKHEKFWDVVQNEQSCCGLDGPSDYRKGGIPWACCTAATPSSGHTVGGSCGAVHQLGCLDVLIEQARHLLVYTALAGLVGALFLSTGIFCSVQLSAALKSLAKVPMVSYKSSMRSRSPTSTRRLSHTDTIAKV